MIFLPCLAGMFSGFLSFADLASLGVLPERQNTRRATGKRDNFGNESLRAVRKQLPETGRWRDILPKQECNRLPHISPISFCCPVHE